MPDSNPIVSHSSLAGHISQTILVVDDDELLRQSLVFLLRQAGYASIAAAGISEAASILEREQPDLILLDVEMRDGDGRDLLRTIDPQIPVILVTARRHELDEVWGLELGAADYITKPFSKDILLARVRSALRQSAAASKSVPERIQVGDLSINLSAHQVTLDGRPISLSPLEFRLLSTLAREPDRVFSAEELLTRVWGEHYSGEPQIVYVYMRELRRKLESDPQRPRRLVTIRSVGYKLVSQEL